MNTDLAVLTFGSPTGADDMLEDVKELQSADFIEILDAVVVTRDGKGKVDVRQPLEVGPGKGAAFGAVTGAVVGLLGGPAGAVVGLVAGGMTGGAAGAAFESGVPVKEIKSVAVQELAPNESALLLYVEEVWLDQIEWAAQDLAKSIVHEVVAEERKTARETAHEKAAAVRKAKIEAAYQSWQARLDGLRASVAAARQRIAAGLQADRDVASKQLASAEAKLTANYNYMLRALAAWHQQALAEISDLNAHAKQANAEAKLDVERRLAAAHEARQAARIRTRETLQTRLNGAKSDLDALKAQAAKAPAEAKQKMDARAAKLRAEWEADWKQLDQLETANDAAWDQMVKSMDAAIDTYEAAIREAEKETEKESKTEPEKQA